MKLAEINALIEQMTLEIGTRQDMLTVLHRLKTEAAAKKGGKRIQQKVTKETEAKP